MDFRADLNKNLSVEYYAYGLFKPTYRRSKIQKMVVNKRTLFQRRSLINVIKCD